ncbi:hypothetical protein CALVIDRAFT_290310 [Calocera viscosa TUFC12733]|uniref:Uncharacterized protein n=1 Tax=Calocera viscosa (strain TUFC12733) TaxID=1330018 RepID=A0A167IR19_CALVF|nr:hypothetical protein CALVIDRAFT_290310 [Calocera viscosa TUFC12733]
MATGWTVRATEGCEPRAMTSERASFSEATGGGPNRSVTRLWIVHVTMVLRTCEKDERDGRVGTRMCKDDGLGRRILCARPAGRRDAVTARRKEGLIAPLQWRLSAYMRHRPAPRVTSHPAPHPVRLLRRQTEVCAHVQISSPSPSP